MVRALVAREDSSHYGYEPSEPLFVSERIVSFLTSSKKNLSEIEKPKAITEHAVNFSQPDYLALSHHPTILDASIRAMMDTSRNWVPQAFEKRMANNCNYEDGMLIPIGNQAIFNILQTLGHATIPVYVDDSTSQTIQYAIHRKGFTCHTFKRLSPQSLDHELHMYGSGIIVVNAISEIDGSVAPLAEFASLAKQHGSLIIVDESHSFGLSKRGTAMVTELNLEQDIHFVTINFTHIFCDKSGIILGPERYLACIRHETKEINSDANFLPHDIAKLSSTLDIILKDEWRHIKLLSNASYMRNRLRYLGFTVNDSQSQIVALFFNSLTELKTMYRVLRDHDILTTWHIHALSHERQKLFIKFIVNSKHNKLDLDRVVDFIEAALKDGLLQK